MPDRLPPICNRCKDRDNCRQVCKDIDMLADGNKPLRERFLNYDGDRQPWRDYKDVLISRQRAKKQNPKETIERIRQIDDPKARLIIAARHAHLTIPQIAIVLNISRQSIYNHLKSIQVDSFQVLQFPDNTKKNGF